MRKRENPVPCIICGKPDCVAAHGRDNAPVYFICEECGMSLHFRADEKGEYPSASEQIGRYREAVSRRQAKPLKEEKARGNE